MRHTYIAIEGPIGVGKTSLAERLAERLEDTLLVLEGVSNPFLGEFYGDVAGSAFRVQLYFLLQRFEQLRGLRQRDLFRRRVVSDYTFEKDKIFAYLTLADSELLVYERLFKLLAPQVPAPDMVVYIAASPDTLMERIRMRGRDIEQGIELDYLRNVCRAYNHFFFHYNRSPLLVVNTDEFDFVHRDNDMSDLLTQIASLNKGTRYYVPRR